MNVFIERDKGMQEAHPFHRQTRTITQNDVEFCRQPDMPTDSKRSVTVFLELHLTEECMHKLGKGLQCDPADVVDTLLFREKRSWRSKRPGLLLSKSLGSKQYQVPKGSDAKGKEVQAKRDVKAAEIVLETDIRMAELDLLTRANEILFAYIKQVNKPALEFARDFAQRQAVEWAGKNGASSNLDLDLKEKQAALRELQDEIKELEQKQFEVRKHWALSRMADQPLASEIIAYVTALLKEEMKPRNSWSEFS